MEQLIVYMRVCFNIDFSQNLSLCILLFHSI